LVAIEAGATLSIDRENQHLTSGHFVFGVGGEFAREYEGCDVPLNERVRPLIGDLLA